MYEVKQVSVPSRTENPSPQAVEAEKRELQNPDTHSTEWAGCCGEGSIMTGSLVHNLGIHFNEDTQTSAWELGVDALQTSKLRALLLLDAYITHPAFCLPM